jgi:hypothetical protein
MTTAFSLTVMNCVRLENLTIIYNIMSMGNPIPNERLTNILSEIYSFVNWGYIVLLNYPCLNAV